jgi:hypothetical protein
MMKNLNPIKVTDPGKYPDYFIPKTLANKILFLKTNTELETPGWKLDLVHSLSLDGDPVNFNADPDINRQELGICSELVKLKLSLVSIASRIRNGGDGNPANVLYTLTFSDEEDNTIESFSVKSDETNPVSFYTKITFNPEP